MENSVVTFTDNVVITQGSILIKANKVVITRPPENSGKKETVEAFHMTGETFDCGDKIGYMEAFVEYGIRHEKLGKEFKSFIKNLAKTL